MKTITLFEDSLDLTKSSTHTTNDVCAFLKDYFGIWPETARLYHNEVAEANEVTPRSVADIEHIQTLDGQFYVIVYPGLPGLVIIAIVSVALAAIALALLFRPNATTHPQQSSNNDLSDKQNKERPLGRIPDIYGSLWAYPDLIQQPYRVFLLPEFDVEFSYMCLGRGSFAIDSTQIRDGLTPCSDIQGETVQVYGPGTSPNSIAGNSPYITVGAFVNEPIKIVKRIDGPNGQTLRAPNQIGIGTASNIVMGYGGTVSITGGGLDFTDYFDPPTPTFPQTLVIFDAGNPVTDPGGHYSATNVNGTYNILSVSSNQLVLENASTVNANWNNLAIFTGEQSNPYSAALASFSPLTVGPYVIDVPDVTEVWVNVVCPNGCYYVDSSGTQKMQTVTCQMSVQAIDAGGAPIGVAVTANVTVQGSLISRNSRGATLKFALPLSGPCQVIMQRTTNTILTSGENCSDQCVWRDLYAVSPVAAADFGNVTTVQSITWPTQDALAVKERKLNMLVTRLLPSISDPTGPLVATQSAADAALAATVDPFIGRRTLAEIDHTEIAAIQSAVNAYFGTPAEADGSSYATQFCYTFDDANTSFEEMILKMADAMFCTAYRAGSVIEFSFEQKTENSTILFNHRNKLPGSETRTVTFGGPNDNDGVEYTYIDPNAPNQPNQDTPYTFYFPPSGDYQNPKRIKAVGIRNNVQAWLHGWRIYNKLVYQTEAVEMTVTQEAALSILLDRILVADNTRPGKLGASTFGAGRFPEETQDGEVIAQSGLVLTLSQPVDLPANTHSATIFLQHYDQTVEAIALTLGALAVTQTNKVTLSGAPSMALCLDPTLFARTTFVIGVNYAEDTVGTETGGVFGPPSKLGSRTPKPFLLTSKVPKKGMTYELQAVNYSDLYYQNDQDYSNESIVFNEGGGGYNAGYSEGGGGGIGWCPHRGCPHR